MSDIIDIMLAKAIIGKGGGSPEDAEKKANKVLVVDENSSHSKYPSAKAVYDFVTNVEDTKASKEEVEELKQEKADDNAVVHNDDYLILDCNVEEGE